MTPPVQAVSRAAGIRRQLCPRCRQGRIFSASVYRGPLAMLDRCAVCGLKFEREPGYFLGAMYISYGLSIAPVLLLVLLIWRLSGWSYDWSVAAAFVAYLPFVPPVTRFARVVWMYLDQGFDPR
ncbi:MAG: DUF983 domain-containing protein [Bryobacteraceae bacterium]